MLPKQPSKVFNASPSDSSHKKPRLWQSYLLCNRKYCFYVTNDLKNICKEEHDEILKQFVCVSVSYVDFTATRLQNKFQFHIFFDL